MRQECCFATNAEKSPKTCRKMKLVLSEGGDEFAVLGLSADGDTEAVFAKLHAMAIANDNALIYQIVVDLWGIGHLRQEEVGI